MGSGGFSVEKSVERIAVPLAQVMADPDRRIEFEVSLRDAVERRPTGKARAIGVAGGGETRPEGTDARP